jgi:hypothetical protein
MTDYDLFALSFFLTLVTAVLKSIATANFVRERGFLRKIAFRAKVKCVIVANQLVNGCRMYDKKPREISDKCYLCAARGGWFRCLRSKELRKTA